MVEVDDTLLKVAGVVAAILLMLIMHQLKTVPTLCNPGIKKSETKVVDSFSTTEIEEMPSCQAGGKAVFCRCWRSKTHPYCDGSHNKYNKENGDNVGPLIIESSK